MENVIEMGGGFAEAEKKPRYRLMITRHAERLPSGELSPEGIEHAKRKGEVMDEAEVLKAYVSDHKSARAFQTGDLISKESGIKSQLSREQYGTRQVKDIQYDVLEPDLYGLIPIIKLYVEEPTLEEALAVPELRALIDGAISKDKDKIVSKKDSAGNPMIDIEKLPIDIQMKIAPIRQKNQKVAFEKFLGQFPEAVHRLAMGLGHQLVEELGIVKRYSNARRNLNKPPVKDVVLNTTTHGLFTESLLREAGIFIKSDGEEVRGIHDFQSEDFGGYVQPAEAIYLDIDDPGNMPDRIPVSFEGLHRPSTGTVFIDRQKLEALNMDYVAWKESQQ
ncbi:MAG: hypothetical protein Q8P77_02520 [Candidatus Veblenbacteria bacterium]|nr:hypothetical protein [Candidatus Veblenbacteria bacterium]